MKEARFAFGMPRAGSYVGGIAFILNKYMENASDFESNDYRVGILDETEVTPSLKGPFRKLNNPLGMFRQKKFLKKAVKENPAMVLHMHTSRLWTFFKDMYIAAGVRKTFGGKMFLSIHFAELDKILYRNKTLRQWELKVMREAFDGIIFLSEETKQEFVAAGLPAEKAHVLYTFHTFDFDNVSTTKAAEELDILFMGSIDKRKGILELLHALTQMENIPFRLHICGQVGDESIREEFEGLCAALGDRVIVHGYVSGETKEAIFQNADLFVLPSYGEGMPIVIFEAMASGCGLVTTDVGAIPEIVKPENGILVKPGDVEGLATALKELASDDARLAAMKQANIALSKEFHIRSNIKKLTDIYSTENKL